MPLDNLTELKRRVPGGKYVLARAVAERARQLQNGEKMPLVEVKTPNPLSVAIDEIVQGKISFEINKSDEALGHQLGTRSGVDSGVAAPETVDETILAVPDHAADARAADAGLNDETNATLETSGVNPDDAS